jgi:hypothetical protein
MEDHKKNPQKSPLAPAIYKIVHLSLELYRFQKRLRIEKIAQKIMQRNSNKNPFWSYPPSFIFVLSHR